MICHTGGRRPIMRLTTKRIRKTTNRIHAIWVAAPAMPLSPRTPAISPMTRKVILQLSISSFSFLRDRTAKFRLKTYLFFLPATADSVEAWIMKISSFLIYTVDQMPSPWHQLVRCCCRWRNIACTKPAPESEVFPRLLFNPEFWVWSTESSEINTKMTKRLARTAPISFINAPYFRYPKLIG
jgi:hypothetical protein